MARNQPIQTVILNAFDVRHYQLVGAPDWVKSEEYDVEAKSDAWAGVERSERSAFQKAMLRSLLAERCQFKAHEEERETALYELVVDKGGLKMQKSADDEPFSDRWGRGR